MMLKYKNNFEVLTSNNPALKNISGKNAVYFTPDGDYLKTAGAPVSGNSSRTVFMVVRPEASVANISLLTMASSVASTGYLSLRTDANGNLAVQNSSGMVTSTNLKLSPDGNYIISCRYDKDASTNNVILSLNGATFTGTLTGSLNTDGPIQLGSDSLTSVTGTSDFTGYIGDVFVFNGALRNERFIKQTGTIIIKKDWDCAPEMDIVKRYLSVKYDLSISLANNYYWLNRVINSNNPKLNDLHWKNNGWGDQNYWNGNNDLWPYKTSGTDPYSFPTAIWLDAFQLSGERINTWTPRIGGTAFNFTVPIPKSLNAIAFNQSSVIAGGDKQNLFQYDTDNQILNQTDSFNVSKYSISDMLLADNEVVALLNNYNNISTQNYIARIAESGNNALLSSVMSHQLNSIYSYNEAALLLVTGNNGTILCSQDKGVTWSSINSGTTRNLSTGCIR
ncbi:MAG: LamG domain-containing protein [Clostridiaceae bacterium]|nr:LamG domain-containing protein [Clostridiaceae bacterium]